MAEQLPINFAIPAEPTITSYNYTDIADGSGKVDFYGYESKGSAAAKYELDTDTAIYSETTLFTGTTSGTGGTAITFNKDFYTKKYNKPTTLKGTCFVQLPFAHRVTVSNQNISTYLVVTISEYNATATTQVTQATSYTFASGVGVSQIANFNFSFDVPDYTIKVGSQILVNLSVYSGNTAGGSDACRWNVAVDPANRTVAHDKEGASVPGDFVTSRLKIKLPFRIDT